MIGKHDASTMANSRQMPAAIIKKGPKYGPGSVLSTRDTVATFKQPKVKVDNRARWYRLLEYNETRAMTKGSRGCWRSQRLKDWRESGKTTWKRWQVN